MPKIPSYALRIPYLVGLALQEEEDAKKVLTHLGNLLGLSELRHHLRAGPVHLETLSFASQNRIDSIMGYTSKSRHYLRAWRRFRILLKATFCKGYGKIFRKFVI